jgi:DNA-directed RNA polymerase sigma subunit (sigma70/sigma32)
MRRSRSVEDHARGLTSEFGVSRARVRRIEVRAFEKVQKTVKSRVAAIEQPKATAALAML